MKGAAKGFVAYAAIGGLWRLAIVGVLVWIGYSMERSADAAKPRLDGNPSALREALGFPWKGFPEISEAERNELENLIPLDPAIRMSDIRPWTMGVTDPALTEAFAIIDRIYAHRLNPSDSTFNEADQIAEAKKRLTAAQETAAPASAWLISYNRGVVYAWEGNRQRAAREFENAYKRLAPQLKSVSVLDEVRSAAIHALYGWGDALIDTNPNSVVPNEAIDALRGAAIQVTNRFRAKNPSGVGHAAEFYELAPTGLSTRALRNDLLTAYLGASNYSFCGGDPMPADVCETGRFRGRCRYRDERFCKTKGRNPLQGVFEAQVKAFTEGKSNEAMVWALQNAVEIEAENPLHDEPVVAYNVAKLLHDLKRPDLAYRFIQPVITSSNGNDIQPAMVRLGWVSSILANEKVGAMPAARSSTQPSGYRIAYEKLHAPEAGHEPPPFQPLELDDPQRGKSLDAWLFIRRYRHLLARGELDTFVAEHRRLNALGDASTDFLDRWKRAVIVDFLRRAAKVREKAQPATRDTINRFLARSDLFTDEELDEAKIGRPFRASKLRWIYYLFAFAIVALLVRDFLWRLNAYRATFISAYRRDRLARGRG
ncbi:MAG TPA: hypothetical protein VFV49_10705 [Thermoanaerobaculia bacterium]|nr:hypothetical protein [Thermoanaerobaculia bacterium]